MDSNDLVVVSKNGEIVDAHIQEALVVRSKGIKALKTFLAQNLTPAAFYQYDKTSGNSLTANGARQIAALLSLDVNYDYERYREEPNVVGYIVECQVKWPDGKQVGIGVADVNTRDSQKGRRKPDYHACLGLALSYSLRRALAGLATAIGLVELMDYPETPDGYPYGKPDPTPANPERPDWYSQDFHQKVMEKLNKHSLKMQDFKSWMESQKLDPKRMAGQIDMELALEDYIKTEYYNAMASDDDDA